MLKKNKLKQMKLILFLISLFNLYLFSQNLPLPIEESSQTFTKDTICINYSFNPGDTLYYRVEAYDSIRVNYEEPLLRHRFERHRIVCDSINSMGRFHLEHTMVNFIAKETMGEIENVERLDAPWVNTKVWYEIDASGRRHSYYTNDSNSASLSPGGAFTPHLFFDLATYCERSGRNWIDKRTIEIPENGTPFPLYKHTTLFRMQDKIDTLEESCARIEFTRTGTGSYEVNNGEKEIRVTNVTNGFGLLDISFDKKIPIHFYMTNEQKLKIRKPNGDNTPGTHHTTAYFTLEEFIPSKRDNSTILNK